MAGNAPVKVYGLDEFARGARTLTDNIEDGAGDAFGPTAETVAAGVRGRLPRRSGRLASTVQTRSVTDGQAVSMGGAGAPYAGWIDYGGTRGRPYVSEGRYLHPSAESAEGRFRQAGEGAARDEIRTMRWPRPNKY